MAAFTTRAGIHTRRGKGLGMFLPALTTSAGIITSPNAGCGYFGSCLGYNSIGSGTPSLTFPPSPGSPMNLAFAGLGNNGARAVVLCRVYKIGTLNLAATGNQFTHDSATFPLLRTEFGEASKPISLLPMLTLTTALTTTAAVLRLRNNTGPAAGYTDQDGNSVTGTTDFTYPSTTTAVGSSYFPILENGDSGVRDISNIDVTTAAATGAADVWGVELIAPLPVTVANGLVFADGVMSSLLACDLAPAVATSGTVTSGLAILTFTSLTVPSILLVLDGVLNA